MASNQAWRLRLIIIIVALFGILLLGKLFFVQIVRGEYYADKADAQLSGGKSYYNRGSIFFEEKGGRLVSAATLQSGFTLAVNPNEVTDAEMYFDELSKIVKIDKQSFITKATKLNDPYEEIQTKVSDEDASKISELDLPGVILVSTRWRFYPANTRASHVVGFVGYKGEELAGLYGLERQYDDVLKRRPAISFSDFFTEILSGVKGTFVSNETESLIGEGDLVTTIEPSVQTYMERELEEIMKKWSPENLGAIIMDPITGEIKAMGALPNFDPGARQTNVAVLDNPLVGSVFEMGSVVKPLTVAAALDAGVIDSQTKYLDKGFVIIDGKKINNFDGLGRGEVGFQEVLNSSLNTGAIEAMERLGTESFKKYMLEYGFGKKTGIDLPGEATGLVNNLNSKNKVDYATASFGQGFATTPIALTRALASLANGGYLVKPHVVKKINFESQLVKNIIPEQGMQVLKRSTSEEITRMLVEVVDTSLLNGQVKNEHYKVAAKTGTAQLIATGGGGGYDSERFLHSFFGYFPASKPDFLIFLYAVKPQGAIYASQTLTEPFINITKFLINYYQIPPDR